MSHPFKIVILTTRGGEGLISGSHAIRDALLRERPDLQIDIIDFFERGGSILGTLLTSFYNLLLRRSLCLNAIYIRWLHALRVDRWEFLYHSSTVKFKQIVREYQPELILVTSQYIIAPICHARALHAPQIPIVVGNIDPATPSSLMWFDPRADLHLIPTQEALQAYKQAGMELDRAKHVTMVVRDRFRESALLDPLRLREELGLSSTKPLILMSGSREGYAGMTELLMRILKETDSQVAIVCGTNQNLQRKLMVQTASWRERLHIFGWRDDIERLLRASDLVIAKPGKQTMIESLATRTPLIAIAYPAIMEQEQGNITFLQNHKVALVATSENEAIRLVNTVLSNTLSAQSIHQNICACAETHLASATVAEAILTFTHHWSLGNVVQGNDSYPMHIFTHEDIPASSRQQIRKLKKLSDSKGIATVVLECLLYLVAVVSFLQGYSTVSILLTALAMMHGSFLMHDASHATLMKSKTLNRIAGIICGAPVGVSVSMYSASHMVHHRFVRSEKDPANLEMVSRKLHVSLPVLYCFTFLFGAPLFIVQSALTMPWQIVLHKRFDILLEYLAIGLLFALMAIGLGPNGFLQFWLPPFLLTTLIMNIRNFSEHELTGSPRSTFTSTRTIISNRFVRWLMNNENYHLEHHLYPDVPSFALPKLHTILEPVFRQAGSEVRSGYISFYAHVIRMACAALRRLAQ